MQIIFLNEYKKLLKSTENAVNKKLYLYDSKPHSGAT